MGEKQGCPAWYEGDDRRGLQQFPVGIDTRRYGIAIGYFLPGYIREADVADQEYLLSTIGFSSVDEFADFFQVVSDCGILPEENIRQVVDIVVENKAKLALCPYPLDKEVLLRIASWRK